MKRTGSLNFKMSHGGCGVFTLEENGNEEILLCFPDGKDQWCTRYNRRPFMNFEYNVTYPIRYCYIKFISVEIFSRIVKQKSVRKEPYLNSLRRKVCVEILLADV